MSKLVCLTPQGYLEVWNYSSKILGPGYSVEVGLLEGKYPVAYWVGGIDEDWTPEHWSREILGEL